MFIARSMRVLNVFLEFNENPAINLSSCQVVGNGILVVGYVSYPIVAVNVADAEDVEAVYTQPDTGLAERWCLVGLAQ